MSLTVSELKKFLDGMDDNLTVLRKDNSGGYEDIHEIETEIIRDSCDKDADKITIVIVIK